MASLGQELRKVRESRNISIEEIASSTKIIGRYIQAVEDDRFDAMPGGFFITGIIRSYAKYLGLDPDDVLRRYREAGLLSKPAYSGPVPTAVEPPLEAARRSPARIAVLLVIGVVSIAVVLLWRARRPQPAAPQVKADAAITEIQPVTPPPAPKPAAPAPAEEEWKGVTIDIAFQEDTWIQVYADGALKIDGLFPAGQRARARADKAIVLQVGNAGGMTFLLNGKPAKSLGRSGQVLTDIRITPENMQEFIEKKDAPPNGNGASGRVL